MSIAGMFRLIDLLYQNHIHGLESLDEARAFVASMEGLPLEARILFEVAFQDEATFRAFGERISAACDDERRYIPRKVGTKQVPNKADVLLG